MAECVGLDYDYLNCIAEKIIKQNKAKLDLERLRKLHPAILRLALRKSIALVKGNTRRITFQHIKELEDLIFNRPVNSIVDLPGNTSVIKKKKYLSIYKKIQ